MTWGQTFNSITAPHSVSLSPRPHPVPELFSTWCPRPLPVTVRVVIVPISTPSPHERNSCSLTLTFQTSYAQRHVTHSLKCPFHRGPCNKVIYHNQRCSGVERSSVGNYAIMMSVTQWRLMLSNVWSRSITLEMLHPVLLGRACMASRHVRSSFDDFL